jgi:hypothetical protein
VPEVFVEPAALQALAGPLADVGGSLAAVLSSGVLAVGPAAGDVELAEALQEFGEAWRSGLAALGQSAAAAGASLASIAARYDGVDALVAAWSRG